MTLVIRHPAEKLLNAQRYLKDFYALSLNRKIHDKMHKYSKNPPP